MTLLSLSENAFTAIPPALASASSLRYLTLVDNPSLVLTAAGIDILAALPALRHLVAREPPASQIPQWRRLLRRAPWLLLLAQY